MPTYRYRCPACGLTVEYPHAIAACGDPTLCGRCAQARSEPGMVEMVRVPLGGQRVLFGAATRTGTRTRIPFVARNRDGSETVYETVEQARRGELERTGNPAIAEANVRYLRQKGYVPGTRQARLAQALDERAQLTGRVGSSVVT